MEYVDVMMLLKLELVVEYLLMVVILVEIKFRFLFFKCSDDFDEEEDFWVEFICWLKEYELVK